MSLLSVLQDRTIQDMNSVIEKIAINLETNNDRALVILMRYNWDAQAIISDHRRKESLRRAQLETVDIPADFVIVEEAPFCPIHEYSASYVSHCGHAHCGMCLNDRVLDSIRERKGLITCFICSKLLYTSFLHHVVLPETTAKLTNVLILSKIKSDAIRGFTPVLTVFVIIGLGIYGTKHAKKAVNNRIKKFQKESPVLFKAAAKTVEQIREGKDPTTLKFWYPVAFDVFCSRIKRLFGVRDV